MLKFRSKIEFLAKMLPNLDRKNVNKNRNLRKNQNFDQRKIPEKMDTKIAISTKNFDF